MKETSDPALIQDYLNDREDSQRWKDMDHRESICTVIEAFDELLADFGLEIEMLDLQQDSYVFRVVKKG